MGCYRQQGVWSAFSSPPSEQSWIKFPSAQLRFSRPGESWARTIWNQLHSQSKTEPTANPFPLLQHLGGGGGGTRDPIFDKEPYKRKATYRSRLCLGQKACCSLILEAVLRSESKVCWQALTSLCCIKWLLGPRCKFAGKLFGRSAEIKRNFRASVHPGRLKRVASKTCARLGFTCSFSRRTVHLPSVMAKASKLS